jgi:thioredoxin-like negative regulator of GroEL
MAAPPIRSVGDYDALRALLEEHPRVAVYLTTPTCGPCAAIKRFVRELFADPSWVLVEVETPRAPDVAGQLLVFAHPTLVLFAEGREAARRSRVFARAEIEVAKARIDEALASG